MGPRTNPRLDRFTGDEWLDKLTREAEKRTVTVSCRLSPCVWPRQCTAGWAVRLCEVPRSTGDVIVSEQKVMALAQDLFRADFPRRSMPGPNSPVANYYVQCAQTKLGSARRLSASTRV